jgi:L-rhamnonate dehydratase
MRITDVQTHVVRRPAGADVSSRGEFLTTPLDAVRQQGSVLDPGFVGLQAGPVGAVIVTVRTDEGISGLGSVGVGSGAAAYIVREHLRHLVLGADPFDVERLWETMFRATINYGRRGLAIEALSAIDIALWDIMGRTTGLPVYRLLGGRTRERIRVYASRLYANENLDALAAEAQQLAARGFTAFKQRFGYGPRDGAAGMRRNIALVRTVREVVGPDCDLMADAYMGWNVSYAIRMIRMLEDAGLDLAWVEEPLIPDDIEGAAAIRRAVRTPISGGEHEFTRYGFRELIRHGAVDVLQPDVNRVGGITEARKIWAMAAAEGLRVVPHAGQMHNYHLVMAHLNSPIAEYFPAPDEGSALDDDTLCWAIFDGEPRAVDGHVTIPDTPGVGVTMNEAFVAASAWSA